MRASNVETNVQANKGWVGVREGIEMGSSKEFGLDELDV